MENKKFVTNKGITLVALVVTIIVLLILAGVAINMSIDSDGLFGKANEAVIKWNSAIEEERIMQNILEQMNKINGGNGGNDENNDTLPEGWDSSKIADTVKEISTITGTNKERIVPIPKGFVASQKGGTTPENTIAGGLVIYQIPEGSTVNWEENTITIGEATTNLQETVNQFVWIPVDDVNQMVMCKSNGKATKVDNTSTDGGKTVCSLVQATDGTLTCTTHNSTDLAGRLYTSYTDSSDLNGINTIKLDFSNTAQQYNADSGYREPANLKGSVGDSSTRGLTAIRTMLKTEDDATYEEIKEDWLAFQQDDFDAMAESVARYGGFYISRYEVGAGGISQKNKDVLINDSDTNNWWGIYSTLRATGKTMIWGSQYDQVIKFIGEQAQVGHSDRNLGKTSPSKSGQNEFDLMNNIYDLEGTLYEWTAEASDTYLRVGRGGNCYNAYYGGFYPASSRYDDGPPDTTDSYFTTRLSLYL